MTVEFFGVKGMAQIGGVKVNKTTGPGSANKAGKTEGAHGASFSSTLEGAAKAQAGSMEKTERAARVEELKAQVANGTYEPDLNKVASSLLQYLVEGN
ncbi:MAG: flagellar biosynthesis anti-sigma factor FlgM [Desulfobulbus propionicus]|nr:MAG: flagellar biosynthesis anti-sigma factor FlgM [Desulfobulbus propionicus]PIE66368.1 MAG: flagellar biosynthesis anti-sigma factor FlgM [Desulfobacterales bacterium]